MDKKNYLVANSLLMNLSKLRLVLGNGCAASHEACTKERSFGKTDKIYSEVSEIFFFNSKKWASSYNKYFL